MLCARRDGDFGYNLRVRIGREISRTDEVRDSSWCRQLVAERQREGRTGGGVHTPRRGKCHARRGRDIE